MNTISVLAERAVDSVRTPIVDRRFAADVMLGLTRRQKSIPSTWLYDQRGSELFEEITRLDEYYPARTEIGILERCASAIGSLAGPNATVVEIGSGSSRKTPLLLRALNSPFAYLPIDISAEFLHGSVDFLRARFPGLNFLPTVGDFTQPFSIPANARSPQGRCVGFFPGSTIGNLRPRDAVTLLRDLRDQLGADALLVVGVDTTLDPVVLLPAYDDANGITADFNLNLLTRVNRELDGRFDLGKFRHMVRFDERRPRVEMHLVSTMAQDVKVLNRVFHFEKGESIHTENCYKYRPSEFPPLAEAGGWRTVTAWTDDDTRFAVYLMAGNQDRFERPD